MGDVLTKKYNVPKIVKIITAKQKKGDAVNKTFSVRPPSAQINFGITAEIHVTNNHCDN